MFASIQSRRRFLESSLGLGAALLLAGCSSDEVSGEPLGIDGAGQFLDTGATDPCAGGKYLTALSFDDVREMTPGKKRAKGLDGRMILDLPSLLSADTRITPTDRFFIRTFTPSELPATDDWKIQVSGLVKTPQEISLSHLKSAARPMGPVLVECSGNGKLLNYGLLSVAEWSGVPVAKLLELIDVLPTATRVLISGFDKHPGTSRLSEEGASWVFTFDELSQAGAFLATEMNGKPLLPDHGFPVRLVMPGWYGCVQAKWLDEIKLVDDSEPTTSQMREFAKRTHQNGNPSLAKDYIPATIDQAAMPVRVEKWKRNGKIVYRVLGISWGGKPERKPLKIRFNSDEEFQPVDVCPMLKPWQSVDVWCHCWSPTTEGKHDIALQVADPGVRTRRLDSGHYVRRVEIKDVG